MHYLIDAYNLLFRTLKKCKSLEKSRRFLIEELNTAISQLHLHVTLVFDGAEKPPSLATRGHFDAIEIVYTPRGQTADEYIAQEVSLSRSPAQYTVVTNDRPLALRCRQYRAKTQTIDEFLLFLFKKKIKKKRRTSSREEAFRDSDPQIARLLMIFEKRMLED
jgi:predicted RNA-binding protein with PIN domain